jgi:hypothetical protein
LAAARNHIISILLPQIHRQRLFVPYQCSIKNIKSFMMLEDFFRNATSGRRHSKGRRGALSGVRAPDNFNDHLMRQEPT